MLVGSWEVGGLKKELCEGVHFTCSFGNIYLKHTYQKLWSISGSVSNEWWVLSFNYQILSHSFFLKMHTNLGGEWQHLFGRSYQNLLIIGVGGDGYNLIADDAPHHQQNPAWVVCGFMGSWIHRSKARKRRVISKCKEEVLTLPEITWTSKLSEVHVVYVSIRCINHNGGRSNQTTVSSSIGICEHEDKQVGRWSWMINELSIHS